MSNVVDVLHDAEDKHLSRAAGAFVVFRGQEMSEMFFLFFKLPFPPLSQIGDLSSLTSTQIPAEPVTSSLN